MSNITIAILIVGIMGIVLGAGLAYASKVFAVKKDPKIAEIRDVLPGANCGACGFPGCDALAEAVALGNAQANACPVGGAEVAAKVGAIMGVEVDTSQRMVAFVSCGGDRENSVKKYAYYGVEDCQQAAMTMGGDKGCPYGCLGYGSCVQVCQFDAIFVNEDGLAEVIPDKCTACGKCIEICPKNVIRFIPDNKAVHIMCNSHDRGKEVTNVCKVGCIACGLCVKNCPEDAITLEKGVNLPVIDYDKCTECGTCVEKCPKNTILDMRKLSVSENVKEKAVT